MTATHCDLVIEKLLAPGEVVVLPTWKQEVCVFKDVRGCAESASVPPGGYWIDGEFAQTRGALPTGRNRQGAKIARQAGISGSSRHPIDLRDRWGTMRRNVLVVSVVLALFLGCGVSDQETALEVRQPDRSGVTSGSAAPSPSDSFTLEVKDGSNGPLTLTRAEIENGSLVVYLDAEYEGIEPFGDEFLITDQGEITARMEIHDDNDVELTFEGIDEIAGTVVLSRVNTSRKVNVEARMGDGSIKLPDGLAFVFSSADITTHPGEVELVLSPARPTSASIGYAGVSRNGETIAAGGYGVGFTSGGQAGKQSISFPLSAKELLEDPDSILSISEIRQVVRFEIPLPPPSAAAPLPLAADLGPAAVASCVERYGPDTLPNRDFAFDGTVESMETRTDPRLPAVSPGDQRLHWVTFKVNRWYKGGSGAEVSIWMEWLWLDGSTTIHRGTRLLVSGEPRWGGPPLQDPIAWMACGGFTQVYTAEGAAAWDAILGR